MQTKHKTSRLFENSCYIESLIIIINADLKTVISNLENPPIRIFVLFEEKKPWIQTTTAVILNFFKFWLQKRNQRSRKPQKKMFFAIIHCIIRAWPIFIIKSAFFDVPLARQELRRGWLPAKYRRESHKSERDRNKMVRSNFLGNGVAERKTKSTVGNVSRLRVPLCFSFFLFRQVGLQKSCSNILTWSFGIKPTLKMNDLIVEEKVFLIEWYFP